MTRQELLAIAKPILFNTEMVMAILDNRKSVTRRVIKPHNKIKANKLEYTQGNGLWIDETHIKDYTISPCWIEKADYLKQYAPYKIGDILYVCETWCWCPCWDCGMNTEKGCCDDTANRFYNDQRKENGCYGYRASFETGEQPFNRWPPSRYMPKSAARIFLHVTGVRVERLQDITIDGIEHEGIPLTFPIVKMIESEHLKDFICLWNSTIKKSELDKYGWNANPFCWVIEFERVETDE